MNLPPVLNDRGDWVFARKSLPGAEWRILDFENCDPHQRVEQHEVGAKPVQVRLDVNFPLEREVPIQEIENSLLAGGQRGPQ